LGSNRQVDRGQTWVVTADEAGVRLDKYLSDASRLQSRGRAVEALERGKVFVNGIQATHAEAARRLVEGDAVRLWIDRPGSARRVAQRPARPGELSILYEDDAIVVVDKPPGLLTVPLPRREAAPSVEDMLREYFRSKVRRRPLVVHRIDRDTSGLVMFAVRADAQSRLKDQFRRRTAERVYRAVVYGVPVPEQGTWRDNLVWDPDALIQKETHPNDPHGSPAECHYRVVESFGRASLLEIGLVTGRRNQIRLQARLRGHMLVGEQRYVYGPQELRPIQFPRQALHAWSLGFSHPATGRPMRFQAPLPADMAGLVDFLRAEMKHG
jgi:23S rRNA pseudouridine1911/1915/1917 synthase